MFIFNKKEVYIGYSITDFSKVRDGLANEDIDYDYKVINHSSELLGRGTIRSNFGSAGMNMNFEKQYIVAVKKNDLEKARYIVNKVLNNKIH